MIIPMEQALIIVGLVVFGLIVGSFNGATVWRLRAGQLKEEKEAGEDIDKREYSRLKKLLGKSFQEDRSVCLYCHHQLAWYDLLPLVSWVQLWGKCRYCKRPIGRMEPLIEIGTAAFFVVSYFVWPLHLVSAVELAQFCLWLLIGSGLIILLTYDLRWFLLPDRVMFPLIGAAGLSAFLAVIQSADKVTAITSLLLSLGILSGLYYGLYIASRGRWIGLGDIKLGLVLALGLGQWPFAFLTLFLANVIGCIIVLPGLMVGKLSRTSHVPFGPMLILAYFIAGLFGQTILLWYTGSLSL
jgi:leader peptidase (prepilin peptidase) / N-methyltransferase